MKLHWIESYLVIFFSKRQNGLMHIKCQINEFVSGQMNLSVYWEYYVVTFVRHVQIEKKRAPSVFFLLMRANEKDKDETTTYTVNFIKQ